MGDERGTSSFFKLVQSRDTLFVNENGIIAGSFLIERGSSEPNGFHKYAWLWWSPDEGLLHLSPILDKYELVSCINQNGFVLINEINKSARIENVFDGSTSLPIEYPTKDQIRVEIKERFNEKKTRLKIFCINAKKIDDTLKVFGEAQVQVSDGFSSSSYTVYFEGFKRTEIMKIKKNK